MRLLMNARFLAQSRGLRAAGKYLLRLTARRWEESAIGGWILVLLAVLVGG